MDYSSTSSSTNHPDIAIGDRVVEAEGSCTTTSNHNTKAYKLWLRVVYDALLVMTTSEGLSTSWPGPVLLMQGLDMVSTYGGYDYYQSLTTSSPKVLVRAGGR